MSLRNFLNNKRNKSNTNKGINLFKIVSCLALAYTVSVTPAYSQQIILDGNTNTTLNINGNITNVDTATIKGKNAFNSFSKFNVDTGNVVNLKVPGASENLINFIYTEQSHINGKLNAIKNSSIGGNIFLVNPHGVVVSSSGEINVGSLNVVTPTTSYMDSFFDSPGNVNDGSMQALLDGTVPINPNAVINVEGKINAITNVKMDAGSVYNAGEIYSGAQFDEKNITIGDVVNINTLENGAELAKNSGEIVIKTVGDFINEGKIVADSGANVDAGSVTAIAGNDIILKENSLISAKGRGESSNGGEIYVFGNNDSYFYPTAALDTRGGDLSGNAGVIELSSKNTVYVGGDFKAIAINGNAGHITIDPLYVTGTKYVNAGYIDDSLIYTGGADLTLTSPTNIAADGVTISTRNIAAGSGGDQLNDASIGNSGNVTFTAPLISIHSSSNIYAHADSGFIAGDVTLEADSSALSGDTDASCNIEIIDSTIIAKNITLTSIAGSAENASGNANATAYATSSNSNLTSSGDINLTATGGTVINTLGNASSIGYSFANNSTLTSSGNILILSTGGTATSNAINAFAYATSYASNSTLTSSADININATAGIATALSGSDYGYAYAYANNANLTCFGNINLSSTSGNATTSAEAASYADQNSVLVSGNSIQIEAISTQVGKGAEAYVNDNSSATAGSFNRELLIDSDGNIDYGNSNIKATINGSNINVEEIAEGNITLIAAKFGGVQGSVWGDGSLTVYEGYQSIDITNNSNLDLNLNNMTTAISGEVIIDGIDTSTFTKNTNTDNTPKDITINALNGNLTVTGKTITSGGSNIVLNATGDITIDNSLISSRNIADLSGGDHSSDNSVGDSGAINLAASNITIDNSAKLFSFADGIYNGDNIKFDTTNFSFLASSEAEAGIDLTIIANDFNIDSDVSIKAGDEIILSKKTAGILYIGDAYELTNAELSKVSASKVIIGNNSATNTNTNYILIYDTLNNANDLEFSSGTGLTVNAGATINTTNDLSLISNSVTISNDIQTTEGLNIITNDLIVNAGANIIADTTIFIKKDGGILYIGPGRTITSDELAYFDSNITFDSDINIVNSSIINITEPDRILTLTGGIINIDTATLTAPNIVIDPYDGVNKYMLDINGSTLHATDSLTLNKGDVENAGICFRPAAITVDTNNVTSDFIQQGGPLDLSIGNVQYHYIYFGNISDISINGAQFIPSSISLQSGIASGDTIQLFGDIETSGDFNIITNTFYVDPTANITADNTIIARRDGGTINVGSSQFLTSEALAPFNSGFTFDNNINIYSGSNITVTLPDGTLSLTGGIINIDAATLTAPNIVIDPYDGVNKYLLDINGSTIHATDSLTLNKGDVENAGICFKPAAITVDSSNVTSDFIQQDGPLNLSVGNVLYHYIYFGNTSNISINGAEFIPSSIFLQSGIASSDTVQLFGDIETSGDFNIITDSFYVDPAANITAGNTIIARRDGGTLNIGTGQFITPAQLTRFNSGFTFDNNINIYTGSTITVTLPDGTLTLKGGNINTDNVILTAPNIVIDPSDGTNKYHLDISGSTINATDSLTIYKGDVENTGIYFKPAAITVDTSNVTSDFIQQGGPLNLSVGNVQYKSVCFGNTSNISINGAEFVPSSIFLQSGIISSDSVQIFGDIETSGDFNIITDTFYVDLSANITAGNTIISRRDGGTLSIGTGQIIDPAELARFNSGFIFDNNVNIYSGSTITVTLPNGILTLKGGNINTNNVTLTAPNIVIDPYDGTNKYHLNINGSTINATDSLTLNKGDVENTGIYFNPASMTWSSLITDIKDGSNNITMSSSGGDIILNNLDQLGTLNNINITATGVNNDISIADETIALNSSSTISSGSTIIINPSQYLNLNGASITASGSVTINKGDVTNNGILFNPASLTYGSLTTDIKASNNITMSSTGGDIYLANYDQLGIVNNINLTTTGEGNDITLADESVTLNPSSVLNSEANIYLIANNFNIDTTGGNKIITTGDVIFSRAIAGDLNVDNSSILTNAELNKVSANKVFIGNNASTNTLTNNINVANTLNVPYDIEFNANTAYWLNAAGTLQSSGDISISAATIYFTINSTVTADNLYLNSNNLVVDPPVSITATNTIISRIDNGAINIGPNQAITPIELNCFDSGLSFVANNSSIFVENDSIINITKADATLSLTGGAINLDTATLTAPNVIIDPFDGTNKYYLDINGTTINASESLTLNQGDVENTGIYFNPAAITVDTANVTSDFINQGGPLDLSVGNASPHIYFGNISDISINGAQFIPSSINLQAGLHYSNFVQLMGDIETSGNLNITSNDFIVDITANIIAENTIIAKRDGGALNIGDTRAITPAELARFSSSLTFANNITIDNASVINITKADATLSLTGGAINLDTATLTAPNVIIDPFDGTNKYYLDINGTTINASESLTLNQGNVENMGIYFNPASLTWNTLTTDIKDASNNITMSSNAGAITLNNLDQLGSINNITLTTVAGNDISMTDETIALNSSSSISSGANITLNPSQYLNLNGASITATANITLNKGDVENNGIIFNPVILTYGSLTTNIKDASNDITMSSSGGDIILNNLDQLGTVNNIILSTTGAGNDISMTDEIITIKSSSTISSGANLTLYAFNILNFDNNSISAINDINIGTDASGYMNITNLTLTAGNNIELNGDMNANSYLDIISTSGNITQISGSIISPDISLVANNGTVGTASDHIVIESNNSTIDIDAHGNIYLDSLYGDNSYSLTSTNGITYLRLYNELSGPSGSTYIPATPALKVPVIELIPEEIVINTIDTMVVEEPVEIVENTTPQTIAEVPVEIIENTIPQAIVEEPIEATENTTQQTIVEVIEKVDQPQIVINEPIIDLDSSDNNEININNNMVLPVNQHNEITRSVNQPDMNIIVSTSPVIVDIINDSALQLTLNKAIIIYNEALLNGIDSNNTVNMAINILLDANITREKAKELIDSKLIEDRAYIELLEHFVLLDKVSIAR